MRNPPGRLARSLAVSLTGSAVPAVFGALGTVLVASSGQQSGAVALLVAWTVVGYLSLTDFGLTRSASRLMSEGGHQHEVILGRLWRVSLGLGSSLVVITFVVLLFARNSIEVDGSSGLLVLCLVPFAAALQFPLVGTLEAQGRFRSIAVQRTSNAFFTYLLPAAITTIAHAPLAYALVSIVASRYLSALFLFRATRLDLRAVLRAVARRAGREPVVGSVLTWLAVSSVVGPALLYVDRVFLAAMSPSPELWIYYVSISELMMKTYVVPSAVLAVLFPWMVKNGTERRTQVTRLFRRQLPAASLGGMLVAFFGVFAVAQSGALALLQPHGVPEGEAALIAAIAVSCTVLNWSSQAYIALLQSADQQRSVSLVQITLAVPYLLALAACLAWSSAVGIAGAWGGRIIAVWLALYTLAAWRTARAADTLTGEVR